MRSLRATFGRFRDTRIRPFAAGPLTTLVGIVFSRPALCGEIHRAVQLGDLEKVQALIGTTGENTPLLDNASNDQRVVAELLVSEGADVNAQRKSGGGPLADAAMRGDVAFAEMLRFTKPRSIPRAVVAGLLFAPQC